MNLREVKKLVKVIFLERGFESRGDLFYKRDDHLIYVVGVQKSRFSDGLYFNLGYTIKELHPDKEYPKEVEGDVRTRFSAFVNEEERDILELDGVTSLDTEEVTSFIKNNIKDLVDSVETNGLRWLLDKDPTLLYQTTIKAKEYLGLI